MYSFHMYGKYSMKKKLLRKIVCNFSQLVQSYRGVYCTLGTPPPAPEIGLSFGGKKEKGEVKKRQEVKKEKNRRDKEKI
jgi:hypothetical protein